jgi:hypothetical protein
MLNEAIHVISELWMGGLYSYRANTSPWRMHSCSRSRRATADMLAAAKMPAAALARGRAGGLISTAPNKSIFDESHANKGEGKPDFGQVTF